jgi:xenotropic and polytropic retrovirus receptor 1
MGLAIPFLLDGLVEALKPDTRQRIPQVTYLLQVWGGLGLFVLFLLLFGINCWVWTLAKINYTFIFEFDPKHHLDYRQYLEVWLYVSLSNLGSYVFNIFGKCVVLVDV